MRAEVRSATVGEFVDRRPLSRFQITTIVLCGIVLVLDGFATQSIGFLAPDMAQSLHVRVQAFGPVFAAALFGLMIASFVAGPVADRIGRKAPIVAATLVLSAFTIATGTVTGFHQLVVFRFLTGLGLGAAIPNVVALVTEYSPRRSQHAIVTALFCGMPLGALLGGLIATAVLPHWGWRAVFYAGGALPLLLAFLLMFALPESLRFLSLRHIDAARLQHILSRIAPDESHHQLTNPPMVDSSPGHSMTVVQLFTEGRAPGTLLLWVPFFMNLLLLYFIVNWLPALLRQTHMPWYAGILGVSVFSLGGIVGSLLQGYVMGRFGSRLILLAEFTFSILLVSSLAWTTTLAAMVCVTFIAGCLVQGAQAGINALAATFYPTSIRSTGVGWSLGIGRLGSIAGPVLGGLMLLQRWDLHSIFVASSLPAAIAALAILLAIFLPKNSDPYRSPAASSFHD